MEKNQVIKSSFGSYFVAMKNYNLETTKEIEKATLLTLTEAQGQKEKLDKVVPHYDWIILQK